VQARTGRKIADLARAGGPTLTTVDVNGAESPNGQYLFPMGIGLGGIDVPVPAEFNINALGIPTIFDGLPWALDRRLSPNGCDGACENTPQPLDPFPFSGRDPRTQAAIPSGPYGDPNYTASQISNVSNRILASVLPSLANFDGDHGLMGFRGVPPVPGLVAPTPGLSRGSADKTPPTRPTDLTAAGVSTKQIDLTWTASTDDTGIAQYLVFRDDAPLPRAVVGGSSTEFSDTGLPAGSTHRYTVQAIDAAGTTSDRTAPFSAAASAPQVRLTPSRHTFGDQLLGTESDAQAITVENIGDSDLRIGRVAVQGDHAPDFKQPTDTCSDTVVPVGKTCTVEVRFAPAAAPGARTARLSVADNAPGAPHLAALRGTAIAPPAPRVELPATAAQPAAPTPAAAPAPAPAPARPTVSAVTMHSVLSRLGTMPLRIAATVPPGAHVVEIRVYRLAGAGPRRARVATALRATPAATRYRFRLTEPGLRGLRPGHYVAELRTGPDATHLGPAVSSAFTVSP
jgi:hypothetical protein